MSTASTSEVTAAGSPDAIGTVMDTVWQGADQAMPGNDFSEIWKYVSGR